MKNIQIQNNCEMQSSFEIKQKTKINTFNSIHGNQVIVSKAQRIGGCYSYIFQIGCTQNGNPTVIRL